MTLQRTDETALTFGQTSLRPQDFVPPRVKIVQLQSQEVQDKLAAPGDLFNTLTGQNYGASLTVAPIQTFMQRIFLVREERRAPLNTLLLDAHLAGDLTAGLACRSFDMQRGQGNPGDELWADGGHGCAECPLSQWRRVDGENKPPLCTELYNIAAVDEFGELVVLSMSKSGAKTGKKFFSAVRFASAGKAPWTVRYEFTTVSVRNELGSFSVPVFKRLPEPTPTDILGAAMTWARQIRGVVIDVTPLAEDQIEETPEDDTDQLNTSDAAF